MSKHFLGGRTYGAYTDTGPGTIVVDPLARIIGLNAASALTLAGGGWNITVAGTVYADGIAIKLSDQGPFVSNITISADGNIFGGSVGISTAHATNIFNSGRFSAENNAAAIGESGN